jgi:hypothetical protein
MSLRLYALTYDALDPSGLADFYAGLLGWERPDPARVVPPPGAVGGFPMRFEPTEEPKTIRNLLHLDLAPDSVEQQAEMVERALSLGASHCDVGQRPDEEHVVLADPEGNELCVLPGPGNFLAGCGLMGCLSCDGTHAVGEFWSAALAWPLVWDEGDETAIQAPTGGTKISWGGPPYMERPERNRIHLDLVADDVDAEAARLLELGARRVPDGFVDPDGNLFRVYPS